MVQLQIKIDASESRHVYTIDTLLNKDGYTEEEDNTAQELKNLVMDYLIKNNDELKQENV